MECGPSNLLIIEKILVYRAWHSPCEMIQFNRFIEDQAMYDRCPWCQHQKCEKCRVEKFPELWFGCCVCGTSANKRMWEEVGSERVLTS